MSRGFGQLAEGMATVPHKLFRSIVYMLIFYSNMDTASSIRRILISTECLFTPKWDWFRNIYSHFFPSMATTRPVRCPIHRNNRRRPAITGHDLTGVHDPSWPSTDLCLARGRWFVRWNGRFMFRDKGLRRTIAVLMRPIMLGRAAESDPLFWFTPARNKQNHPIYISFRVYERAREVYPPRGE